MAKNQIKKSAPAKAEDKTERHISFVAAVDKLKASAEYPKIRSALAALPDWNEVNDTFFGMTLHRALIGPRPHEKFTKSDRVKTADKISSLAKELAHLLYRVHGDRELGRDWPFEFQGLIDHMALSAAVDFKESAGSPDESELAAALADDEGEAFHATRYGIYHTLTDCMPETLEMLSEAAQYWKEAGSQPLAKPNHKNAARLYFIRVLTEHFVRSYGKPMRELTLNLTSVYYDCSDIDEAALSNLAPVTERLKNLYEMDKRIRKIKLSQRLKKD